MPINLKTKLEEGLSERQAAICVPVRKLKAG
jgi:hypothetical protein